MSSINAFVVKDSISESGKRIVTLNIKYSRYIHPEFLRHRVFSRSVKSSRAIPSHKLRKEVICNPYIPEKFGINKPGMQATEEYSGFKLRFMKNCWRASSISSVCFHYMFEKMGIHKEVTNRILEPYMWVEETITATEFDNFFSLRIHPDAQQDIQAIAIKIKEAVDRSEPSIIKKGEYHLPYVSTERINGSLYYFDNDDKKLTTEEAIICSIARCARSSYANHDRTDTFYINDLNLYDKLINSKPAHSSPAEHQATPFVEPLKQSRNYIGWKQYREILEE